MSRPQLGGSSGRMQWVSKEQLGNLAIMFPWPMSPQNGS